MTRYFFINIIPQDVDPYLHLIKFTIHIFKLSKNNDTFNNDLIINILLQ